MNSEVMINQDVNTERNGGVALNMDALFEAVRNKGPVCVGLDTAPDYLPPVYGPDGRRGRDRNPAAAILDYNKALVDATFDLCACYKVQIAYYESLGIDGLAAYRDTLRYIKEHGGLCIADIKRGDIADTAAQYAKAHFSGDFEADFVTLSPYMGMDTLDPWLAHASNTGKGAFVLLRTSNPGARDFQWAPLKNGEPLYTAIADKLVTLAEQTAGKHGYGAFGAVVGCTDPTEAAAIREHCHNLFLLIPGYGAQGGGAKDAARLLQNNNGGIVNASRSILCAWKTHPGCGESLQAAAAARDATAAMRDALTGNS
ncbi:MAG: orotidine-5'-phosphate decarboxylase [Spirochaetaceae bacterium]|jgi:orotidine-5'-phosphate decarboxylase|nr:orotidine-5'-phosphate decarboxylase [Spirochaetaceae bacterium]